MTGRCYYRRYGVWVLACVVAAVLSGSAATAQAQTPENSPDPIRFIDWIGQDVTGIVRGLPTRRTLYVAGGMAGMLLLLSPQDEELTKGAVDLTRDTFPTVRRTLNEIGNVRTVRPLALLLFLGSLLSNNERYQDAAFTSLEAVVFSNLITNSLKSVVGRARPYQDLGAHAFSPLSGNTSFPSGHATTVFAFTTPWLLYYRNAPTIILFVLGAGTAFVRMADNVHWLTDVLAGSAIGFTTGLFLARNHRRGRTPLTVEPIVAAEQAGVTLRLRF